MALYNYFLDSPFGPGPRTLEWIYLDRTGGTPIDLDSEPTTNSDVSGTNCRIVALNDGTVEIWQLLAGNHASDPPNGWVRPLDFGLSVNEKVWKRLLCFGTGGGGGGGGTNLITNEVPGGAINGSNTVFSTSMPIQGTHLDVFVNGLRQRFGVDYTLTTSTTFTMTTAPVVGDILVVDYIPSGGGGMSLVTNEIPSGAINSVNTTFGTSLAFQGTPGVFLNGLRQRYVIDYTVSPPTTFNMTSAPITGDTLIVDYIPQ